MIDAVLESDGADNLSQWQSRHVHDALRNVALGVPFTALHQGVRFLRNAEYFCGVSLRKALRLAPFFE